MQVENSPSNSDPKPSGRARPPWFSYAGLVVVGLFLGATGIAVAADGTPSPAPSSSASADAGKAASDKAKEQRRQEKAKQRAARKGQGLGQGHKHGAGRQFRGGPNAALHGEFVVPAGDGKFETLVVQRGRVTAVSAGSITLKSADGFTRTYAINADTKVKARGGGIAAIAKGDHAHVTAIAKGDGLTAQLVHDRPAPGQGRDKPKPSPSPSGSAS